MKPNTPERPTQWRHVETPEGLPGQRITPAELDDLSGRRVATELIALLFHAENEGLERLDVIEDWIAQRLVELLSLRDIEVARQRLDIAKWMDGRIDLGSVGANR